MSPRSRIARNTRAARTARIAVFAWSLVGIAAQALAAGPVLNHPTGTHGLLMVDKMGGRVLFFDRNRDRELSEFAPAGEPGMRPHELALSPDGKTAYVTVYGTGVFGNNPDPGHAIAIINLAARKMIGSIDVSPYRAPHGIQVDASGLLYVACDLDHKVLIVDPRSRRVQAAIDVDAPGHWLALAVGPHKVYVSSHGAQPFVGVIDTRSRRLIDKVPVAHGTMGIAASPDGATVLAADAVEPFLHVISTATDLETDRIRVQGATGALYKVFFSPNGRYVLTCLPSGQINIFDAADLRGPQRILQSGGTALMGFAFSADGGTALTGNHGEGTVSRIDLKTGTLINTFAAGKGVETLTYY